MSDSILSSPPPPEPGSTSKILIGARYDQDITGLPIARNDVRRKSHVARQHVAGRPHIGCFLASKGIPVSQYNEPCSPLQRITIKIDRAVGKHNLRTIKHVERAVRINDKVAHP